TRCTSSTLRATPASAQWPSQAGALPTSGVSRPEPPPQPVNISPRSAPAPTLDTHRRCAHRTCWSFMRTSSRLNRVRNGLIQGRLDHRLLGGQVRWRLLWRRQLVRHGRLLLTLQMIGVVAVATHTAGGDLQRRTALASV